MKAIKILIIAMFVTIGFLTLQAQEGGSPPPPPPDNFTGNGNVPGGGAPIAGGIGILLALGAIYGGKKVWDLRKSCPSVEIDINKASQTVDVDNRIR